MRKFLILNAILLFFFATNEAMAFNLYRVGEKITGQEYNGILKNGLDREFSIWVGVTETNTEYIFFKGDTGLGDATVMTKNLRATREKLKSIVGKAIEWSDIARKNQVDTSIGLGCFGSDEYGACEKNGSAFDQNQMGLSFFASNWGKQKSLIISMVDRDNQFVKTSICVDLFEMKKLLKVIGEIENEFKKAHKTVKDQNLFK